MVLFLQFFAGRLGGGEQTGGSGSHPDDAVSEELIVDGVVRSGVRFGLVETVQDKTVLLLPQQLTLLPLTDTDATLLRREVTKRQRIVHRLRFDKRRIFIELPL
jgi:hypothetical protein